jgi:radical SAM protein with 4Fe4S-binding SPASM domain
MSTKQQIKFYFDVYDYFKHNFSDNAALQPLHMFIEPTNTCNLDCPFCDTSSIERTKKNLSIKSFENIINQIVENNWHNNIRVTLTGQGEPFINKNIPTMTAYAKKMGIKNVEIITNATLLNEEISEQLIVSGIDRVQFSIDSIKKETYDILRPSKRSSLNYFNKCMKNILNFLYINEMHNHKVYVSISAVLMKINTSERKHFMEYWKSMPVDNIFFPPLSSLQDNSPTDEAIRFDGKIKEKPICIIPWMTLNVKADGDLVICSHDYHNRYPIGNIETDKLKDVWNNQKAKYLRKSLIDGELEYFQKIKHNCIVCNNPCQGANKEDFTSSLPTYLEKTLLKEFHKKPIHNRELLEKELKKYV